MLDGQVGKPTALNIFVTRKTAENRVSFDRRRSRTTAPGMSTPILWSKSALTYPERLFSIGDGRMKLGFPRFFASQRCSTQLVFQPARPALLPRIERASIKARAGWKTYPTWVPRQSPGTRRKPQNAASTGWQL